MFKEMFKEMFTNERNMSQKLPAKISSLEKEIEYLKEEGKDKAVIKRMEKQLKDLKDSYEKLGEGEITYIDILARELMKAKNKDLDDMLYKKFHKMMKSDGLAKKALKQLERTHDVSYQGLSEAKKESADEEKVTAAERKKGIGYCACGDKTYLNRRGECDVCDSFD